MKQAVSKSERAFVIEGIKQNVRSDGRTNIQSRPVKVKLGTVPEAFGSSTVTFGEEQAQVICVIKAEVQKPLASEANLGMIQFHLESS